MGGWLLQRQWQQHSEIVDFNVAQWLQHSEHAEMAEAAALRSARAEVSFLRSELAVNEAQLLAEAGALSSAQGDTCFLHSEMVLQCASAATCPSNEVSVPQTQQKCITPYNSADESLTVSATFTVTIQKADGGSLGLKMSCDDSANALLVESVVAGGAVEAWNRNLHKFSAGGLEPQRAVRPGDRIIEVNGIWGDPPRLASECAIKRLLKIKIHRGGSKTFPFPSAVIATGPS